MSDDHCAAEAARILEFSREPVGRTWYLLMQACRFWCLRATWRSQDKNSVTVVVRVVLSCYCVLLTMNSVGGGGDRVPCSSNTWREV